MGKERFDNERIMKPAFARVVARRARLLPLLLAGLACHASQPTADALNAQATALIRRERYDSAIAVLDRAIAAQPTLAEAYRNRGRAYRGKNDVAHALSDFDHALTLEPGNAHVYNDRAITYQFAGDLDRAIHEYSLALEKDPNHALARKNRGRAEFFAGRLPDAADDLRLGLQLDSTNAYVAIWLYFINRRLARPDTALFAAHVARTDPAQWPAPVAQFYLGKLTEAQLFAAAKETNSPAMRDQTCAVSFYLGEDLLVKKRAADAVKRFEETRAACPKTSTEYEGAVAELARLQGAKS
jgi:lipoprotein NlpI